MTRRRLNWSEPIPPEPGFLCCREEAQTPFGRFVLSWALNESGDPENICWLETPWDRAALPCSAKTIDEAIDRAEELYRARLKTAWFDCTILVFSRKLMAVFSVAIDEEVKSELSKFGKAYGRNFSFEMDEFYHLHLSGSPESLTVAQDISRMLSEDHDLAVYIERL